MRIARYAGVAFLSVISLVAESKYFPPRFDWKTQTPSEAGFDAAKLKDAIEFAVANQSPDPRDLRRAHDLSFAREAYGEPLGPFQPRGDPGGVIVRHGYVVAEWGEPNRPDMTFSVTKSFLSTTVGLALERGLIHSLNDPVRDYVPDPALFNTENNRRITWDHLLRQTSDWEGTLWGKPDWADRPPKEVPFPDYIARKHAAPGTTWKYNDVRVNLLALAALDVWRRPLPQVLREYIMDPIGASNTWSWYGYENSWVNIDGVMLQSVSGGGHYGGGMVISARDMARFGLLTLNRGNWAGKQLIPDSWVRLALTPTAPNKGYGFMNWYLNTDHNLIRGAKESAFCHIGNGTNAICADPSTDTVAVVRWIKRSALDEFVSRILAAIQK